AADGARGSERCWLEVLIASIEQGLARREAAWCRDTCQLFHEQRAPDAVAIRVDQTLLARLILSKQDLAKPRDAALVLMALAGGQHAGERVAAHEARQADDAHEAT